MSINSAEQAVAEIMQGPAGFLKVLVYLVTLYTRYDQGPFLQLALTPSSVHNQYCHTEDVNHQGNCLCCKSQLVHSIFSSKYALHIQMSKSKNPSCQSEWKKVLYINEMYQVYTLVCYV
jgi:hypothetical protein